jgi:formate--tetrahydrofolate ligase
VVKAFCDDRSVAVEICTGFADGGAGAEDLAKTVARVADQGPAHFKPIYDWSDPVRLKVEKVAKAVYGAQSVQWGRTALKDLKRIKRLGLEGLPVCIAKTQSSLTDDPKGGGLPKEFVLQIREIEISAGAGFVVPICGEILRMPGLPRVPGANRMHLDEDGEIVGLA